MDVRWTVLPVGSREDAERYARNLQEILGGRVHVGRYLAGIDAWEVWVGPPRTDPPAWEGTRDDH